MTDNAPQIANATGTNNKAKQMSNIDLSALTLAELKTHQKDVAKAIKTFEARKLKEARAALTAKAQEMGYTLEELTGAAGARKAKSSAPAKYRHPENSSLTWSGRGRQPTWFKEAIQAGASPDDLEISK